MRRVILAILATIAVGAGLAGGLVYTWILDPVEEYESAPDSLYIEDKLVYLALIGDLYVYEEDLEQAEARLALLDIEADGAVLADLIEQYLDGGRRPEEVRNLARLARDLGASGGVLLVFGSMPAPSPSPTSAPGLTPLPSLPPGVTLTPVPTTTPAPIFRLVDKTSVCAEPNQLGRIAVWVLDAAGKGLANVEVVVTWSTGQDRFFTGLRPEKGMGYADFEMKPQTGYDVTLADRKGDVAQGLISDLSPGVCPTGTIALSWQLTFQQAQ